MVRFTPRYRTPQSQLSYWTDFQGPPQFAARRERPKSPFSPIAGPLKENSSISRTQSSLVIGSDYRIVDRSWGQSYGDLGEADGGFRRLARMSSGITTSTRKTPPTTNGPTSHKPILVNERFAETNPATTHTMPARAPILAIPTCSVTRFSRDCRHGGFSQSERG